MPDSPLKFVPATATVWSNDGLAVIDMPASDTSRGYEQYWFLDQPRNAAAVGLVAVDYSPIGFAAPQALAYDGNGHARAALALGAAPLAVEMWGRDDGTAAQPLCARVELADSSAYFVRYDDADCDGIPDHFDCKPDTYCDPAATSGPAHDACICP